MNEVKNKRNKRKISKPIIAVLIIFIVCALAIAGVAWYKLSQINAQDIDKSAVDVNNDLYNDVSDKVSKS